MALQYSPKIVTDSLVMCLDASNNKSYPTDLPVKNGLLLWLDAADDTTFSYSSGTVVSQWRDKSGNNFHANQSTTAQQPSRNTINNSRKSVFFNAASRLDYMTISSGISLPTDASIFIIYKPSTQIYEYAVLIDNYHGQGGNYGFVIQRVSTNAQFYYANAGDGTGFIDTAASPWTYTNNVIQLLSLNKASSTGTPYISGTAQTSRSVRAATAQYTTGLAIGYWGAGGGRFYNGDMCEILIFNRSLSSTEMKQVHTYLGQKWGISNTDRSIVDLSGNNNHGLLGNGTVANMPDYNYYNKSLTYNKGQSDTLVVTNSTSLKNNNTTIELYMKFNSTISSNTGDYIQMGIGSGVGQFYFRNENPNLTWNWYPASSASSNLAYAISNFSTDRYYLITLTGDSAGASKMYVDGVQVASAANVGSGITTWTTNNLTIGGYVWDGYSNSDIALTRIYSRVLSAAEISQNYEAIKSRFANTIVQQGLVLNLDAGNPYSYAGAGSTWYDVSGNTKDFLIDGSGITYNSGGYFTLADGGITRSATITNSTTCTVVVWIRTTDTQALTFKGNSNGSFYLAAYYVGSGFYNENCGSPTYWIDTLSVANPNPTYLDGNWHMWEMKNVNFSSWTSYEFNKYGSYTFGNGAVGQIMIYDRNLSSGESLQIYNATKGRFGL